MKFSTTSAIFLKVLHVPVLLFSSSGVNKRVRTLSTIICVPKYWKVTVVHSWLQKQPPRPHVHKQWQLHRGCVRARSYFMTKDFRDVKMRALESIRHSTVIPIFYGQGNRGPNRLVPWKVNKWARIQTKARCFSRHVVSLEATWLPAVTRPSWSHTTFRDDLEWIL